MKSSEALLTEVQELVWALIDEQATEKDVQRLESLLLQSDEARQTYVMCMQMHSDLHYLLGGRRPQLPPEVEKEIRKQKKPQAAKTPLPLVDLPPLTTPLPVSGNLLS